jgi:glucose uptake protein GlcU
VTDVLYQIHMWLAYAATVVVLVGALMGFGRAKDAREFSSSAYALPMVLLDIVVTLGLILYVTSQAWQGRPEIAYIHPVLAVLALGVGHALVGRAKGQRMAVDAHRMAARGLLIALLFVAAAIGVASAPAFL